MLRVLLAMAVGTAHRCRRAIWFFTRPHTDGVHAIPLTPEGKVVLVRLTYRPGWHLPGGRRESGEEEVPAVLRELREEIGLTAWSSCELVFRFSHRIDWKDDDVAVFLLRGVEYRPRWSIEIAATAEFAPDALPPDVPARARALIGRFAGQGLAEEPPP
jgi:8-oxo-dGTP pyrophosphatase MutT (NUDIX family)